MAAFRIGQVATLTGASVETIRFYEHERLIPEPPRSRSGYRQYPDETVRRVRFIRRAKQLGFTLGEVREFLELRNEPGTVCEDVKTRVLGKIGEIDRKAADLARIRAVLVDLADRCEPTADLDVCPVLEALDDGEDRVDDEN